MKMIDGLAEKGSWTALADVMKRAEKGEALTIGFLGGSITQGSLSSTPETCYAYLVYDWWCKKFPKADFSYVNGGIGGTSSHYGAARAWEDVLRYRPDVVVVDFSVNDEGDMEFFGETFEGLLRQLVKAPSHPAVVVMNNVFYDDGRNAQESHNRIAAHYGIPCVSMKDGIYQPLIETGKLERPEITPDNLHPNDKGHKMVADIICGLLEAVWEEKDAYAETAKERQSVVLPEPLTENAYESSRLIQITADAAKLEGFRVDPAEKKGMLDLYKNGWTAEQTDDKIIFELECSCLAVQYRKSVQQPVPVAVAVVDGDEANAVVLDGNFEETWGDCLYLQPLLHHAERKMHHVEIRITKADEIVRPFYLVSVITS